MTGDLYINGKDAYTEWGINMGDDFLDVIDAFAPMKDYIENDSRLEHGKKVIVSEETLKVASREMTLHFTIIADTKAAFRARRDAFESELRKGRVEVRVPELGSQIYKLIYLGKSVGYAMNRARTFCTISAKFEEPNPTDRTAETNS